MTESVTCLGGSAAPALLRCATLSVAGGVPPGALDVEGGCHGHVRLLEVGEQRVDVPPAPSYSPSRRPWPACRPGRCAWHSRSRRPCRSARRKAGRRCRRRPNMRNQPIPWSNRLPVALMVRIDARSRTSSRCMRVLGAGRPVGCREPRGVGHRPDQPAVPPPRRRGRGAGWCRHPTRGPTMSTGRSVRAQAGASDKRGSRT